MAFVRQLNNLGVRALVEYCKSTLTSVDLSDCTGLNDEVGWVVSLFSLVLHWKHLSQGCKTINVFSSVLQS